MTALEWSALGLALALCAYLFCALLRPEIFQ